MIYYTYIKVIKVGKRKQSNNCICWPRNTQKSHKNKIGELRFIGKVRPIFNGKLGLLRGESLPKAMNNTKISNIPGVESKYLAIQVETGSSYSNFFLMTFVILELSATFFSYLLHSMALKEGFFLAFFFLFFMLLLALIFSGGSISEDCMLHSFSRVKIGVNDTKHKLSKVYPLSHHVFRLRLSEKGNRFEKREKLFHSLFLLKHAYFCMMFTCTRTLPSFHTYPNWFSTKLLYLASNMHFGNW